MKGILPRHNKAVSELISYTLLIAVAVIASTLVYSFLKLYTPKDNPQCQDGVSLIIKDYACTFYNQANTSLNLTLSNKGKFTVDAAYIRIGKPDRTARTLLNPDNSTNQFFILLQPGKDLDLKYQITPSFINSLSSPINAPGPYVLEIQPGMNDPKTKKLAACSNIISQQIECH